MKEIADELTQHELRIIFVYDEVDGNLIWRERCRQEFKSERSWKAWNTRCSGKVAGSKFTKSHCNKSYIQVTYKRSVYAVHRLIYIYLYGEIINEIDHINGNGCDNRKINLRDVSKTENRRNTRISSLNTSGLTGVKFMPSGNWMAVNGIGHSLGTYTNFFDSCCARKSFEYKNGYHSNHGKCRVL